ncbi:ATP-binding protein [Tritonibacter scottomollicae]|uniref:histidine kinase n=1 Tax=Tritonibacter scottomollicae TaxID=483013 RepID=A0ABZ0HGI7_TRISK|nr:ATP-binding protein [Tritonibacter scottomollicae]WOI33099.1 ATP-binding protein [Tritonibacter scottomollicae]
MKRFLERTIPRIWTRLFILTVLAVLLTWIVIALAIQALQDARSVVSEISTTHVPDLTQTSQLSAQIADLAILSNELLFATSIQSSPIRTATTDLSRFLVERLEKPEIEGETREIVAQLDVIAQRLDRMQRLEQAIREDMSRLRWLGVELEEETSALVADFSFNIQSQTRKIVTENNENRRAAKARFLAQDIQSRDQFSALASELSRLISVVFQIADASSHDQMKQLEDIYADSVSRVFSMLRQDSDRTEFLTIQQSLSALEAVTIGPEGLARHRQEWLSQRNEVQAQLEHSFNALSRLQKSLQNDARDQRQALAATVQAFSLQSDRRQSVLLIATVLALAGGFGILFLYVRPVIIRPMQNLTGAMHAIASGQAARIDDFDQRHDEIGQLTRAVHAFQTSVHERDQAIAQLQATQNELVQAGKMAALGNLSAGISHELNQPLGAIKQRLHMLQAAIAAADTQAQARQTAKISDLTDRMERIIQHLRKFARRSEYLRERVQLQPLVQSAMGLMSPQFTEHGATPMIDSTLSTISFIGDPVLVEQVIVNLLSNASDAIAQTGKAGEIRIESHPAAEGNSAFSVVDTGAGLGDLEPHDIIEPFVTSKPPGAGLGLGLSISYNILKGLGGDLVICSRRDQGVRATVTLPSGDLST